MTEPLRIALNAMYFDPGVSGGTETYLRELVPAMVAERPGLEVVVLTTGRGARALREAGWTSLARIVALPSEEGQRLRRLRAEQLTVPVQSRRRQVDLLHSLANTGPLFAPVPHVLTVHDVSFFTTDALPPLSAFAFRQLTSGAARRADGLLAVSEAARDEICAVLGLPRDKFTVAPHGAGRAGAAAAHEPEAALRARHDLVGKRVVLCVAAKRPHKNQELLLRALGHLPADIVAVLAGHPEGYERRLRDLAGELDEQARVRFLGHVDDAELDGLWALASCACFPTRAEGFGLPVVEAMRRGVPVACSGLRVLREVGGDVPAYFDPDDAAGAAAAIERAIGDATAKARGRERAAGFTWAATARKTLAAYERAVATRR
jgi:glycosyltransferase involved in cell wall biosynthesis